MKNNKIKIVEYIRNTFRFYVLYPCGASFMKSSLIVMVRQFVSYLFYFCVNLLHAEEEPCVNKNKKAFFKAKKVEDVEVLYKEGLVDIHNIAMYIRSHYKNNIHLLISQENRHSKHHIDDLFVFLRKTYYSRVGAYPIVIKGTCCSFKLVVNPLYRTSTKYSLVSNIVKTSLCSKNSSKLGNLTPFHKNNHAHRDHFFFSKGMNSIDKITIHDRKDVKQSIESLSTFLMHYRDQMYNRHVSWYSHINSDEYKVMVLTDIVSSTKLWCDSYEEMSLAVTKHDYIALGLIDKYGGVVSRNEGDSFFIFFESVENATKFSVKFNKQIRQIKVLGKKMAIKIAIHAGVVKMSAGRSLDAYGKPVHEIYKMLSHTPQNKICIKENLLNKMYISSREQFCIH